MLKTLIKEINALKNPGKAKILQRFFKTGKGEYGEGDVFLGLIVPVQRQLVKKYWQDLNLKDLSKLLKSKIHEHRLIALLVLVKKFENTPTTTKGLTPSPHKGRGGERFQKSIFNFYLKHSKYINNWDLVDLSAPKIVGAYLQGKNKNILYKLIKSKNLWERRIAVLATFDFIYRGDPAETLKICKILINDKHDLIHKASGWMLREAGKRCGQKCLTDFLNENAAKMPRTMLRYSIERLPNNLKKLYLLKKAGSVQ